MAFTPPQLLDTRRWQNLNVGLFGGSFNPPHEGHLHVCDVALRQFDLDFIWWMVTPQNPLKKATGVPPYTVRLSWSHRTVRHPRVLVTDIEHQIGTHVSIDTVKALKSRFPRTNFIWLTGTDNALIFHKWDQWQDLIEEINFAFIARPPALSLIKRVPVRLLHTDTKQNTQWILSTKMINQSSTNLRFKA